MDEEELDRARSSTLLRLVPPNLPQLLMGNNYFDFEIMDSNDNEFPEEEEEEEEEALYEIESADDISSNNVDFCKECIKNPMNIALLVWVLCVAVSSSLLGLLLLGLLDADDRESRYRWIEINNQVLNALFTLLSLYQHPNLFRHSVLLCRWRSEDVVRLRKAYCKSGVHRPHEWAHMTVVVILLHVTCFSQYVLCGLYWGYSSEERPVVPETVSFAIGTVAPIAAGAYAVYSPLGRESDIDDESGLSGSEVSMAPPSRPLMQVECVGTEHGETSSPSSPL